MPASRSLHFFFWTSLALAILLLFFPRALGQQKDGSTVPTAAQAAAKARAAASYGHIPLSFEANRGQTDASVQFLSRGQGYTLFLRSGEAVLALRSAKPGSSRATPVPEPGDPRSRFEPKSGEIETSIVRMKLVGANPRAAAQEEDEQITKTNYFIGNDPAKWRTNVPNYGRVRYTGIYPGIDLVYYGNQSRLEHDFVVAPGADPAKIRMEIDGSKKLRMDPATGDLIVSTSNSEMRLLKPVSYEESNGLCVPVASSYKLLARNQVAFNVGIYKHAQPLVIDPVLVYSTYLGVVYGAQATAIAIDSAGSAYVTGTLSMFAFAYDTWTDYAFVAKLDPAGTSLVFETLVGEIDHDGIPTYGTAIKVDESGDAYFAGGTVSTEFPVTKGAFQTANKNPGGSAFITKLDPTGSTLLFSTLLGGSGGTAWSGFDEASSIAFDSTGDVYVAGVTDSQDFPVTTGALQTKFPPQFGGSVSAESVTSGFISKLNAAGTTLIYSTYLGGSNNVGGNTYQSVNAMALDSSGDVFAVGGTNSPSFPITSGAFQTTPGLGFVSKLDPNGAKLVYSTYFPVTCCAGPFAMPAVDDIAIDDSGDAYVVGVADPKTFPVTSGAFQTTSTASITGFVSELDPSGSSLVYSTLLGGSTLMYGPADGAFAIALDPSGNIYVTGQASSNDLPVTANAFQRSVCSHPSPVCYYVPGGGAYYPPLFLSELSASGSALIYSTYFGDGMAFPQSSLPGPFPQLSPTGHGIAVDSSGNVYLAGQVNFDLPTTPGAYQPTLPSLPQQYGYPNGGLAGYVAQFNLPAASGGASTSTTLAMGPPMQMDLNPFVLTASVAAIGSGPVPTGDIVFRVDGQVIATVSLDGSGSATYTLAPFPPSIAFRSRMVAANYEGSSIYNPSADDALLTVVEPCLEVVTGGNQETKYGDAFATPFKVQLSSCTSSPINIPIPGIPVTFSGAGLSFPSATVMTDANGQAQVTATPMQAGNLTATATITNGPNSTTNTLFYLRCLKIPLEVSVKYPQYSQMIRYGDPIPVPTAYTIKGFVNGDTEATAVTGAPVMSTPATSTSPVGTYPIDISRGTLAATNYILNWFYPGIIQIYRANLTLAANSYTIQQGQPIPTLGYTITGFVNGETQAIVSGAPVLYTPATSSSPPGVYPIEIWPGTLSAPNYQFPNSLKTNGTVTITAGSN